NALAEYIILSGVDSRPPTLNKDLYDSWKSRMELYMKNREHERMILESVESGSSKNAMIVESKNANNSEPNHTWGSNTSDIPSSSFLIMTGYPDCSLNGVTRTKKYAELSAAEKIQADCYMKATNIILQGLPANIYSLVNHYRVAKVLWEREFNY
nr:hypothetical protein [Tanacetum cinerariifolium]